MEILRRCLGEQLLIKYLILLSPKYKGYHCGRIAMVYKIFDEKCSGSVIKSEIMTNKRLSHLATRQVAEKCHKPIIRKFEKPKVQSSFKDNIRCADLADM